MPTDAPKDLYNPDVAAASVQPLAAHAERALSEVIRQGAAIMARCIAEVEHRDDSPKHDHHLAIFINLHHVLEMLDSANALLVTGRSIGARPAIRSAFEALLALEYLLQDPARMESRAYAFLVADVTRRLSIYERYTPGTATREELDEARKADRASAGTPIPAAEGADEKLHRLRRVLDAPHWREAAASLEAARKGFKWVPWYAADDGPRSIKQLAASVGRPYQYEVLYEMLSSTVHAKDAGRILGKVDGQLGIATIPNWTWTRTGYSLALNIGLSSVRQVLMHYRDEREFFKRWYREEIQDAYHAVNGLDFE